MLLLVDVSGYLSQVQYILSPLFGIGPSMMWQPNLPCTWREPNKRRRSSLAFPKKDEEQCPRLLGRVIGALNRLMTAGSNYA